MSSSLASSRRAAIILSAAAMAAGIVRGHCPGAYGANSCDAHHTFKEVPEQYSELPLLDLQAKWAPLRAMEEFDTRQASSGGGFVSLELTPAYYLGPAYNTEILSYNGMSRKFFVAVLYKPQTKILHKPHGTYGERDEW
eukprot:CAMPEP_0201230002 /NCGR_PEP_ID=MMETSP0852-20130820/1362_1 /ASSEMBLY_ACC=CAM_ASM_000632 /TAXON_ID=183588 /ORGANISM="Pseudo-nitzschia fraudulenta, Strain WWA7" /LENGTH=138 /DNA_ID=CAMNT_0047520503 /DNA_START=647 /DNA_END=1060 /DNA_ORIENTATION=+